MYSHICRHRRDHKFTRAYTLVELVIVLMIVGILAAVAAPKYSKAMTSFRLQAVADRIAGDIRYAKRMAQQKSSTQLVVFDPSTDSYSLTSVTDMNRRGRTHQFSLTDLEYECDLVSADFGGSSTLTFSIFGRPTNSGTVVVSCAGTSATLTVDSLGQVSVP